MLEEEMSDAYHGLRIQHLDLTHQGLDFAQDMAHSSLLTQGLNTLSVEESNFLASRIHPILGAHEMFESGQWDNLKNLFNKQDDKFFACAVALGVAILVSQHVAAVAASGGPSSVGVLGPFGGKGLGAS